ncbi:hypothetical protein M7I_2208 [Glarea lozoyensis 74030]|uniref:Uncharacterized protein n=1 Tax=Glarea lozoyensis (strain ATCC 74030 / MF5533) TaxID=1104152 RepID=H0EI58_GLAL7|nr:hypothetical protein M7I_2208 [Glarea lozoyensis 74030]
MSTGGPSHAHNSLAVHADICSGQREMRKHSPDPSQRIDNISHGSFEERCFRAQPVVDTDRQETSVQEHLSLLWANIVAKSSKIINRINGIVDVSEEI